jgi:vitamin B12 transporter
VNARGVPARRRPVLGATLAAAALWCGPLGGAASLVAQEPADSATLREIVVTATRLPAPLSATTSAVTVITGAELRERGVTTVGEALRSVPGAAVVETGPIGSATSLFLRGGESDYVRVLLDGVPLNSPGGSVDLASLSTVDVARIEVVRGPASVLYGSDAVSGVVQVFTRRGGGPAHWEAAGAGGTFGSRSFEAALAGGWGGGAAAERGGGAGWRLSWSRFADDGVYAFNNAYRNDVADGSLALAPGAGSTVRLAARYGDALYQYPTDGLGNLRYHHQWQRGRTLVASLAAGHRFTPVLEARLLLGLSEGTGRVDQEPNDAGDTLGYYAFSSVDRLGRRSADVRAIVHLAGGGAVTAGAVFETEAERNRSVSLSRQYPSDTGSLVVSRWNRAAYAEAVTAPAARLSLNAGVRAERNEAFGSFVTVRGGAAYRLARRGWWPKLRATFGTAFKEPSFFENYATGYVLGNPDLAPERSRSWDAGIEEGLSGGRLVVSATWFVQRFRNLIQYTFTPPAPGAPNYFNIAAARASGLELALQASVGSALALAAQYTYTRTAASDSGYDGAAFAEGRRLLRRPTHAGSVTATARLGGGSAGVTAYYVGNREDEDFATFPATRVTLPACVRVDLAGALPLLQGRAGVPRVTATLKVENLFDARYQQVLNFPSRRRAVFAGVRLEGGF